MLKIITGDTRVEGRNGSSCDKVLLATSTISLTGEPGSALTGPQALTVEN